MDDNNQVKIGEEFVIAEQQAVRYDPLVGLDDGGFIVTWTSNVAGQEDNSGFGVYGQRFDSNGEKVGTKFLINQTTSGNQEDSDVTIVNGNIVVSYTGQDASGNGVFTREFELIDEADIVTRSDNFEDGSTNGWSNTSVHDGGAEASKFLGRIGGSNGEEATSKTYDFGIENANKVVEISFDFYELDSWDWEYLKVFVDGDIVSNTRYHVHANEAGGEKFSSNVEGTAVYLDTKHTITLKATLDENGEFTLGFGSTLNQDINDESYGIDNIVITTSSVNPVSDETRVNTHTASNQDESSITTLADGSYVVSWTSYNQDGNSDGIFMQKFDSNGDKIGSETSVNTYYSSNQNDSMITGLNNGSFVVTWTSYGQDGSYNGIYMQRFSSDGEKLGAETQVNETTYHNQQKPSIDALEDGGFVISWTGYNTETSSYDVYTQKYSFDGSKYNENSDFTVSEDEVINIDVLKLLKNDSDDEGDSFEIISVQDAANGTVELITNSDGSKEVKFTPNANFSGLTTFTYTIEDIHGAKDTATVTINVLSVNDDPIITITNTDITEDTSSIIGTVNDIDGTINLNASSAKADNGTVVIDSNGNITYTPNANYHGIDIIKLTVIDSDGGKVNQEITLNIVAVDDAIIAVDDGINSVLITDEDSSIIVDVLENDINVDNDVLTITNVTNPVMLNGVNIGSAEIITVDNKQKIKFTPNDEMDKLEEGESQNITFSYTVTDGRSSDTASVSINVTGKYDAATINEIDTSLDEDISQVIANVSNVDSLIKSSSLSANNGTASIDDQGNITYSPNENYNGSDVVTINFLDENNVIRSTETISVIVDPVNDAPEANEDNFDLDKNKSISITFDKLLENDNDIDGDSFSLSQIANIDLLNIINNQEISITNGIIIIDKVNETITFTPNTDYVGDINFAYSIKDSLGLQSISSVNIEVQDESKVTSVVGSRASYNEGSWAYHEINLDKSTTHDTEIKISLDQAVVSASKNDIGSLHAKINGSWVNIEINANEGTITVPAGVSSIQTRIYFNHSSTIENTETMKIEAWTSNDGKDDAHSDTTNIIDTSRAAISTIISNAKANWGGNGGHHITDPKLEGIAGLPAGTILKLYVDGHNVGTWTHDGHTNQYKVSGNFHMDDNDIVYATAQVPGMGTQNFAWGHMFDKYPSWNNHDVRTSTPLALDLDNDGIETLSLSEGVRFDIDADGDKDKTGWIDKDDGLLVRDINNDGIINNGSELFGQETIKADGTKAKDGYDALAELDSNHDGVINSEDDKFDELQVWKDLNSDGITNENELISLEESGVSEISLTSEESSKVDNGNIIGLEGTYKDLEGNDKEMADVWFSYDANLENEAIDLDVSMIDHNKINLVNNQVDIINIKFEELIHTTDENDELIITGDKEDKILLEGGIKSEENKDGKWESAGNKTDDEGHVYNIYQSTNDNGIIKLLIDDDIDINNI